MENVEAETVLLLNYDERIDETITYFRDRFDALRRKKVDETVHSGERNLFNMTKKLIKFSNYNAIIAALAYCNSAITELENMKLAPKLDQEKIEKLKAGIPKTNAFTETTGEKVIPGSKDVNPRHLLKSDSQLEWELGKILKKFEKIIKRA